MKNELRDRAQDYFMKETAEMYRILLDFPESSVEKKKIVQSIDHIREITAKF